MRAVNLLRQAPHYRRQIFDDGLRAAEYTVVPAIQRPQPGDVLVCWNRYNGAADVATQFERAGARVLVIENNPLGNDMHGGSYSIARGAVAVTGGSINYGGPERWDRWGVHPGDWKHGTETVILGQRGIGSTEAASPPHWAESVRGRIGGRIRPHPGTGDAKPLTDDLSDAKQVVTWSSSAALQALLHGVPVWYANPLFAGAPASRSLTEWGGLPQYDDAARLEVFRRLAWGIWSLDEIRTGKAIRWALA